MKEEITKLIKENPLFKELDDKDIEILVKHSTIEEYKADEFIFSAREPALKFYLIIEGAVSIQMFSPEKGSIALDRIDKGELAGWSWLKEPYKWRFDCLTLEDSKFVTFSAAEIKHKMDTNNKFGYKLQNIFMRIVIDRLASTQLRLSKELGDNIFIPDII